MRKQYQKTLKAFFYNRLIQTREERKLTQAKMAELLAMDDRSYIDLDHGKSCCSALTLVFFLLRGCNDPMKFLKDLGRALGIETDDLKQ